MSSMDFSDPQIWIAHDELLRNTPTRWFLLEYGHGPHVLVLSASGTGDVDELRTHLKDNVCYAIFREQTQDNKSLRISINYIPASVKGVWRARALVHVTAVASKFKVHEVLTISTPDQLSVRALRSTLNLLPRVPQGSPSARLPGSEERPNINSISRNPPLDTTSISMTPSPPRKRSPSPTNESQSRPSSKRHASSLSTEKQDAIKATDTDIPSPPTAASPLPSTSSSRIGSLLTKISTTGSSSSSNKSSQLQSLPVTLPVSNRSINSSRVPPPPLSPQTSSRLAKQDFPLPPPPESKPEVHLQDVEQSSVDSDGQPVSSQIGSIPDSNSVASLYVPDSAPSSPPPSSIPHSVDSDVPTRHSKEAPKRPIDGLPPTSLTSIPTSQPAASRPVTNREVAANPGLFSAPKRHLSRFQERASSPAEAEEERKLVVLEGERRRRAAERARREKEIREEEEARQREFEDRKEREKKRRVENARKSEERRVEQKRQQEEEEARRKAEKERKDAEVRERRNRIKRRFEKRSGMDLLSGFITLESSGSWKRRYCRLSTEDWVFFKNDEDTTVPIHTLELSRIRALREWNEGYEELEAIPYSFAVEFKDDTPCLFFADSAEDKEILLGLLNQAASL